MQNGDGKVQSMNLKGNWVQKRRKMETTWIKTQKTEKKMNEGNFENIEKMMRIDEGRWKMKKSWKNEGRRREPMKYEEDTLGKYLFCLNLAKKDEIMLT